MSILNAIIQSGYISETTSELRSERLYITTPSPRTEIENGDSINISCNAADCTSVKFYYKNVLGVQVEIGSGSDVGSDTWTYNGWTPTEVATSITAIAQYADGGEQSTTNILYSVSLYDTFTDTSSTAISDHTPDSLFSNGWVNENGGTWIIDTNELDISDADTNKYYLTHDTGTPNVIIQYNLKTFPTSGSSHQIVLRYVDANNYLIVDFGSSTITLGVYQGGSFTELQQDTGFASHYGSPMEIRLIDNQFNLTTRTDSPANSQYFTPTEVNYFTTATKHGVSREANDNYHFDDFKFIPIELPRVTTDIQFASTKLNSFVINKNEIPPDDAFGLDSPDIFKIGTTNYCVFAAKDGSNSFSGLTYATSSEGDPHNWTRYSGIILASGSESIADSTTYYDADTTTFYVIYSDRLTGIMHYATGSALTSLTKQGQLFDLTGSLGFVRQPSIVLNEGTFYLFFNLRTDKAAGNFGHLYVCSGSTPDSFSDFREVLSTPSFAYDQCDLTTPSVRYKNGYWQAVYSGFIGGGSPYIHKVGMAVSKNPYNMFVRISDEAIIDNGGSGSIDEIQVFSPEWFNDDDFVYYIASDSDGDRYDGITYAVFN